MSESRRRFRDRVEKPSQTVRDRGAIRARTVALNYSGAFPFMVDMRRLAIRNGDWLPSPRQIAAIDRCVNRATRDQQSAGEASAAPAGTPQVTLSRLQQAAVERERRHLSGRL